MIKRISDFFIKLFYGLGFGMKNAENEILLSKHSSNTDSSYIQQIKEENVGKDLLKGEVTQEVEDLRYSTYKVCRESDKYEYVGDGITIKKDIKNFDINNFSFVQRNKMFCKGIYESFNQEEDEGKVDFTLSIIYNDVPKFRLERFIESINVKCINGNANISFRFDKSFDLSNPITRMFYNELMKIKDDVRGNEIYSNNIANISFTTFKCQGDDDFILYQFNNLQPLSNEFFEDYVIITFSSTSFQRDDLMEKFYSSNQNKKYEVKEEKKTKMQITSLEKKEYRCSICGEKMNQFDYEITFYDFGQSFCLKCLEKYLTSRKK